MTDAHSPFADEALPPVYLAPMAGFTDAPFRLLCREQGCGHTVTEMVSAKGLLFGSARTGALLDTLPGEGRVTVQLFGRDPAALAEAARLPAALILTVVSRLQAASPPPAAFCLWRPMRCSPPPGSGAPVR